MTIYTATEHGKPIPATVSEFASIAVLKGLALGREVDGFTLEAGMEDK